jgi:hypothetical protein
MRKFYFTIFILDFKYKIKIKSFSSLKVYFSAHHINNIKKKHNTILLYHWISEIIIKTIFNNTLKDGVTSPLRMMCVNCSGL